MNASKKRYDKKHKVTRIWQGDYALLVEMSRLNDLSMAEVLHKLITREAKPEAEPAAKESPAQIPMPVFHFTGKVEPIRVIGKVEPVKITTTAKIILKESQNGHKP